MSRYLLSDPLVEPADGHVVPDLAEVLRAAGRVGQAGVDAVVVDARLLQLAVVVGLALALQGTQYQHPVFTARRTANHVLVLL